MRPTSRGYATSRVPHSRSTARPIRKGARLPNDVERGRPHRSREKERWRRPPVGRQLIQTIHMNRRSRPAAVISLWKRGNSLKSTGAPAHEESEDPVAHPIACFATAHTSPSVATPVSNVTQQLPHTLNPSSAARVPRGRGRWPIQLEPIRRHVADVGARLRCIRPLRRIRAGRRFAISIAPAAVASPMIKSGATFTYQGGELQAIDSGASSPSLDRIGPTLHPWGSRGR